MLPWLWPHRPQEGISPLTSSSEAPAIWAKMLHVINEVTTAGIPATILESVWLCLNSKFVFSLK